MPALRIVLASASPARLATLRAAGVNPLVVVSGVDEEAVLAASGASDPSDVALLLARAKAEDVSASREPGNELVLGCDSVLDLDGEAFGKPVDAADAAARWRRMRGHSGVLRTGHWLVDRRPGGTAFGELASTTVHFAALTDTEIDAYVATGEPLAVAGAFTIDGLGGPYVTGVEGDHHTVVGLGLPLLREMLARLGIAWHQLVAPPAHGGRRAQSGGASP